MSSEFSHQFLYNYSLNINFQTSIIDCQYRKSETFHCKFFFVVCTNNENKHKIYFTTDNHLYSQIFVRTASYFALDGPFDTSMSLELMYLAKVTTFHSVSDKSCLYCHSKCLRSYLVPFARQQWFINSCMVATNAACKLHVFVLLACVVLFQITKPWERRTTQKFTWVSLIYENMFTRKFKTRK